MEVVVERGADVGDEIQDAWIERIVRAAVENGAGTRVGEAVQVVVLLADDATLHDLNQRFRHKDAPTDVLSFEGSPEASSPACAMGHLGDIAISVERARRQADEYGHSFDRELAYLLTHGTLHLLGFDHEDDADQRRMRVAEERALLSVGLTRQTT